MSLAPAPALTLQAAKIATASLDEHALLVLAEGRIAVILIRLDDPCHGEDRGRWFLEAGFGPCEGARLTFAGLADGLRWTAKRFGIEGGPFDFLSRADQALVLAAEAATGTSAAQ